MGSFTQDSSKTNTSTCDYNLRLRFEAGTELDHATATHLRVPKEMGVRLASTKRLRPHPSVSKKSAAQGDNSTPAPPSPVGLHEGPGQRSGRTSSNFDGHHFLWRLRQSCPGINAIRSSACQWRFQTTSTLGAGFQHRPAIDGRSNCPRWAVETGWEKQHARARSRFRSRGLARFD